MKNIYPESSELHVTGKAVFVDDLQIGDNALSGLVYHSPVAHAEILSYDLEAAKNADGVKAIISCKDIPGKNQIGAIVHDEPILADGVVQCIGQAVFLIAAETPEAAHAARQLITVEYKELGAVLTIEDAMRKNMALDRTRKMECGNVEKSLAESPNRIEGTFRTGAQEHWYLETQISLCVPCDDGGYKVYSATQNPTETQISVAEALGIPQMKVEVEVRRIGGGFGGKETQACHPAVWAALLSHSTGQKVKLRLERQDDQIITGKRHPYLIKYRAGFDDKGMLSAVDVELNSNAGYATDLSLAVLERSMFHAENAYFVPNMRIRATAWRTNLPPNVAFRGFGAPQAMAAMENIMDRIAGKTGKDAAESRRLNFYSDDNRNLTPYGQTVTHNTLQMIYSRLIGSSEYFKRRREIDRFNSQNEFLKKGIALTPVKFGISFTTLFLNQAGALVNIYTDGSVLVNHGGTEMGQGLYAKIRQITADAFGLPPDVVKVSATSTSCVPNTSPTAASSGSDLNGQAVLNATEKLAKRIQAAVADEFNTTHKDAVSKADNIIFANGFVADRKHPERKFTFAEMARLMRLRQISLSATGFYRTPDIFYDRSEEKGSPFFYYVFGMSVSEVLVDVLTGQVTVLRSDILQDTGKPINKDIDIGQIEGGFVQGMGWCTSENCVWNSKGKLLNASPATYKIPGAADIPADFRTGIFTEASDSKVVKGSKAVGEPPFMLALSVWFAIKDAVSATAGHKREPDLQFPATNDAILVAIDKLRNSRS
ncbi:xanthine dehydrogenase molybdopterin binding sub unit [Desulfonema ishimotonii]|uniref:Xanthine dehydrogenase molybdopterin binding sub unit n=1 Tax=Desulfonema ishimotonii TaxID=45657 RepID=A0A401FXV4_9BACT|nr:xanthine dehydrogenase molybdopterin binding subunit [Desulfonema ishimotonii]GBC61779.1 xanthine dehydrogenase molybdopterin binding sub unit [Desulfonema ishimotonii]